MTDEIPDQPAGNWHLRRLLLRLRLGIPHDEPHAEMIGSEGNGRRDVPWALIYEDVDVQCF